MFGWLLHAPLQLYFGNVRHLFVRVTKREALLAVGVCTQRKELPADVNSGKCGSFYGALD